MNALLAAAALTILQISGQQISGQPDDMDVVSTSMTREPGGCVQLNEPTAEQLAGGPFGFVNTFPAGAWLVHTGVLDDSWELHIHPRRPSVTLALPRLSPAQDGAAREAVLRCFLSVG